MAKKLVCRDCGCTDDKACPGGCAWYSKSPPVCTSCYVKKQTAGGRAALKAFRKAFG
jgi:hypothetical protein